MPCRGYFPSSLSHLLIFISKLTLNPHPNEIRNSTTEMIVTLYSVTMYKFEYFICNEDERNFCPTECAYGNIVPASNIAFSIFITHARLIACCIHTDRNRWSRFIFFFNLSYTYLQFDWTSDKTTFQDSFLTGLALRWQEKIIQPTITNNQ